MTRHRLDLFSLLSGLTLTAIALVALFGVSLDVAAWVGPAVLIGVGVVVLVSVLTAQRDADATPATAPTDPTDPADPAASGDDPERAAALSAARAEVDREDVGRHDRTD